MAPLRPSLDFISLKLQTGANKKHKVCDKDIHYREHLLKAPASYAGAFLFYPA